MAHPTELQLNDYVERALSPAEHVGVTRHLEECVECAALVADLQQIAREAAALGPIEPPARVWEQLQSRVLTSAPSRQVWWRPAWALATAALVVLAFFVGRIFEHRAFAPSQQVARPGVNATVSDGSAAAGVRERVLLVAVGDHLERSQMVLVELANAQAQDAIDISAERQSADELLASNRLYRQTAVQMGDTGVADVLDDLERVLVEIARGPSRLSMQQLAAIQQQIEAQGILFRVKIIRNNSEYR